MIKFIVGAKVWERDWHGSIGHMQLKDYHWIANLTIEEDGSARIYHPSGDSHDISSRKRNWSYEGGKEVSKRAFHSNCAKKKAAFDKAQRDALYTRLISNWREPMQGDWTDFERSMIDDARVARFRRARPKIGEAIEFVASVTLPDDLVEKWSPLIEAETERLATIARLKNEEVERIAATWNSALARLKAGETLQLEDFSVDRATWVRPRFMPKDLWNGFQRLKHGTSRERVVA